MNKKTVILLVVLGLGFGGQTVFGMKKRALAVGRTVGQAVSDGIDYVCDGVYNAFTRGLAPEAADPKADPTLVMLEQYEAEEAERAKFKQNSKKPQRRNSL